MNCFRCQKKIQIDKNGELISYQLSNGKDVCIFCSVVGEELMPDSEGPLQVSKECRDYLIKLQSN